MEIQGDFKHRDTEAQRLAEENTVSVEWSSKAWRAKICPRSGRPPLKKIDHIMEIQGDF